MLMYKGKMRTIAELMKTDHGRYFYYKNKDKQPMVTVKCAQCGVKYRKLASKTTQRFCSLDCRDAASKEREMKRNIERLESGKDIDVSRSYIQVVE